MKEYDFIKIIKDITQSNYLGDDCAYLKDLGIVITQDNFVEDIHFKTDWASPYQIGYKAAIVNISDILASGAKPAYLTVGLSLPNYINEDFIKELYRGITTASHGAKVVGGDITGGDKIFISITAIGKVENRKISSRANAKVGYVVISNGEFGISSKGLEELRADKKDSENIKIHLEPILDADFSETISKNIKEDYAMMDASDGLADALFQIAKASGVKIITKNIEGMFGAEDYNLVAAVPKDFLPNLKNYNIIGTVEPFDGIYLKIDNHCYTKHEELPLYDHFNS